MFSPLSLVRRKSLGTSATDYLQNAAQAICDAYPKELEPDKCVLDIDVILFCQKLAQMPKLERVAEIRNQALERVAEIAHATINDIAYVKQTRSIAKLLRDFR